MDAASLEIFSLITAKLDLRWNLDGYELQLPDYRDANVAGMMLAHVRIDDGSVMVTEFDGWETVGEYRFSGEPIVMARRVGALLTAIVEERA